MSLIEQQRNIRATIEITYSKLRKQEMEQVNQKNCSLLVSLLKKTLEEHHAKDIEIWVPKVSEKRIADVILEFTADDAYHLREIEEAIKNKGGLSVDNVALFVEVDD